MSLIDIIKNLLIYRFVAESCNDILDCMINWKGVWFWKKEKFIDEKNVSLNDLFQIYDKYKISITALAEYYILIIKDKLNEEDPRILDALIKSINNDLEPEITEEDLSIKETHINNLLDNSDPAYGFEIIQSVLPENPDLWINAIMMMLWSIIIKSAYEPINDSLNMILNEYHLLKNKKKPT